MFGIRKVANCRFNQKLVKLKFSFLTDNLFSCPLLQVDGCSDDWIEGLIQLDGPMDSDDIVDDEDGDDETAGAELEGDGEEEQEQEDGAEGADGGFDAGDLDAGAEGSGDVVGDAAFVSAADELSAAAASAGFTAAELSSHAAALDADDPAAAYMMQV